MDFSWKPVEGDSERIYAFKLDYFEWAKKCNFAQSDASKPEEFVYAVRCNIQDQAAGGYLLDVKASKGENLIYRKTSANVLIPVNISDEIAEGLARIVLNIKK